MFAPAFLPLIGIVRRRPQERHFELERGRSLERRKLQGGHAERPRSPSFPPILGGIRGTSLPLDEVANQHELRFRKERHRHDAEPSDFDLSGNGRRRRGGQRPIPIRRRRRPDRRPRGPDAARHRPGAPGIGGRGPICPRPGCRATARRAARAPRRCHGPARAPLSNMPLVSLIRLPAAGSRSAPRRSCRRLCRATCRPADDSRHKGFRHAPSRSGARC